MYLHNIGSIQYLIFQSATEKLVHEHVTSKVAVSTEHCSKNHPKTKKSKQIIPILYKLHWPPVHARIKFKILLLSKL